MYKPSIAKSIFLHVTNASGTLRYAEVLLMAAEANNRIAAPNDGKAQGYLNQVRRRAFGDNVHYVTATGAALRQAIWDERRLELAMEGDRFFNLVRIGQAAAKITGFVAGKNEVFPIPQLESKHFWFNTKSGILNFKITIMKAIKYFLSINLLLAVFAGCKKNTYDDTSFVNEVSDPTKLSVLFDITQDNTGLVTITHGRGKCSQL